MKHMIYLIAIILVILFVENGSGESFIPQYPEPNKIDSFCSHLSDDCCLPYNCQACREGIYYRRW